MLRLPRWLLAPAAAAVVAQVFVWYTQEGLSLGALAHRLNVRQVAGPTGRYGTPARWGVCCVNPLTEA